jgi:pimeloyl-ACP methyl ester carboxylesterase
MKRLPIFALFLVCAISPVVIAQGDAGATAEGKSDKIVETDTLNGAPFQIDVPANWNKILVLYCHGYQLAGTKANFEYPKLNLLRNAFVTRGFAFALSGYRAQGWAIKEAIEDNEALRRHFIEKYGQPRETFVMGHSMGAVVTLATIEKFPDSYNGAMPLCGPLHEILNGFRERVFDMLVTFDYLFPGTIGPLAKITGIAILDRKKIQEAVNAAPEKAAMFAKRYSIATVNELPNVLAFFYEINRELQKRADGNPFDNRNTIYDGFDDNAAVNRGVKRYAADAKAREYLRQYYTPNGRISDPVLAVHTTYDPLIPGRYVSAYEAIAGIAGKQDLFIAKYVEARKHCDITLPQTMSAFDELLNWVHERKRPEPGEVKIVQSPESGVRSPHP